MENYSVVLVILAVMIGLSAVADKVKLPYPVLLITAGIGIGFIPAIPDIELNPEIVFLVFLPPLLYDAAFNISFKTFKTNINTISTLAITLVFITASGIAVFAHYLIPGMTWPLSFVLGAILSATDAVAAMSITKGPGPFTQHQYHTGGRKPGERCLSAGGLPFCCRSGNRFGVHLVEGLAPVPHPDGGRRRDRPYCRQAVSMDH